MGHPLDIILGSTLKCQDLLQLFGLGFWVQEPLELSNLGFWVQEPLELSNLGFWVQKPSELFTSDPGFLGTETIGTVHF